MPGYIVACVTWHNTAAAERYGAMVIESLRPFGGHYLVRGKPIASLEGTEAPQRLAIVEFPSAQSAQDWWSSQQYAPAKEIREANATTHWLIVMEGIGEAYR